ncbi:ppk15, partial [Cucurbita argyrosperma subsp. argyrosperma]
MAKEEASTTDGADRRQPAQLSAECDSPAASTSASLGSLWHPRQLGFGPYLHREDAAAKPQDSRFAARIPLVARLTKDIVETYRKCNPEFKYSEELNLKRYLTSPSIGVLNDDYDNVNSDLILAVNSVLLNFDTQRRYVVKDLLGHGTFGQVAKCWVAETNSFVAVKIIKNQPAYYQQALVEVSILTLLNKKYDPQDKHHIVRIYDYFVYQRHLCICFELLDTNLYELIKMNYFMGLSLSIVQMLSKQILCGLALLKDAGIIHCDLKPENILLCTTAATTDLQKFCLDINVTLNPLFRYTTAIDMWSFGCIVAELFLGLPLFPGASEFDLLRRMIDILGGQPPDYMLKEAKHTSKFFKFIGGFHNENGEISASGRSTFQVFKAEEYEAREMKKPSIGKEYFNQNNLEGIVTNYPYRKNLAEEDRKKESQVRLALIDFLKGLVEFDPAKRWSPSQASKHPFVTGEPFTCPYTPPPETRRLPVSQNIKVDGHHPGGGHWFAAGLSPNIAGRHRVQQSSPHFQMVPYAHANSYGSIGSHGSYSESIGFGNSYGSYGDNGMLAFYSPVGPSGMNMHPQRRISVHASSPDTRQRTFQLSHGNGIGVSPSTGNFAPLPLGTSPSQFTPPSSYGQVSVGSSGHYGPTSPARGSCQGSPLGKMATVGHFNRRKFWDYSGTHDGSSSSHWQGQTTEGTSYSQADGNSLHGCSPSHLPPSSNATSWKQQQVGCGSSAGYPTIQSMPASHLPGSNMQFSQPTDMTRNKSELPDPGDWDPNYSDELLLQDDGYSDVSSVAAGFSNLHVGSSNPSTGTGRFSMPSASLNLTSQRKTGPVQAFPHVEVGSPPSAQDLHTGHARPSSEYSHFMPHSSYNSPSRLGQQPVQRFNQGRSTNVRGYEWNAVRIQPPLPSYNSGGPRSPGSGMSWGYRANQPVTSIPPSSRGRKDYGRI